MFDQLDRLCLIFMLIPVMAYCVLFYRQFTNLQTETYRLTVLCVRAALFLPYYSILMYFSVLAPNAYVLMIVVITIVEGYSFYCFLALITTNLGGPMATIDFMRHSEKQLFCSCCCPSDSAMFYRKTTWAIFNLFITRSVLSVLSAVCFYSHTKVGKLVYVLVNCLSAGILFYGVICLVNLYENVFEHCTNLFGVVKLILLKVSVGAIVVQGLAENFLYSSGTSPFHDDDRYDAEDKTLRAYCALVLLEFVVLSVVYFYAFGYKTITASTASALLDAEAQRGGKGSYATTDAPLEGLDRKGEVGQKNFSFWTFVGDVLRFQDVIGVIAYKENDGELYQPLTATAAG